MSAFAALRTTQSTVSTDSTVMGGWLICTAMKTG